MMYIDDNNKISFSHKDIMTLEAQQRAVAHLEADLIDKVQHGLLPRYLYKYRTIDECKDILINSHLHFSTIAELRDPFEGRALYGCSDISKIREDIANQPLPSYSTMPQPIQEMAKRMILDMPDAEIIKLQTQAAETMLNECGTLCLTGRPDDICMWAYYADSHKGVCLKLDLLAQPLLFCPLSHVLYDKSYHNIDLSKNPGDAFFGDVMLKKSIMWAYEDEYRTVATHFAGNYPIANKNLVDNVIFGYYCKDDDKADIKALVEQYKYKQTSFSAIHLNEKQYQLIVKPEL